MRSKQMIPDRGFITIATTKQQQVAAATLANSIKTYNPTASVTMVVPSLAGVLSHHEYAFDYIVEFPFTSSQETRSNDWQLYWASPYDNSIFIDCYSVLCNDISYTFDYLMYSYNVCLLSTFQRFNNNQCLDISETFYSANKKQTVNSNIFFFDKSEESLTYFKMADPLMQNWRDTFKALVDPIFTDGKYDTHLMHRLVIDSLGNSSNYINSKYDFVNNIDMQRETHRMLKAEVITESWLEKLNYWVIPEGRVKVQNFTVNSVLTYADINFITDEVYGTFRNTAAKRKSTVVDKV